MDLQYCTTTPTMATFFLVSHPVSHPVSGDIGAPTKVGSRTVDPFGRKALNRIFSIFRAQIQNLSLKIKIFSPVHYNPSWQLITAIHRQVTLDHIHHFVWESKFLNPKNLLKIIFLLQPSYYSPFRYSIYKTKLNNLSYNSFFFFYL